MNATCHIRDITVGPNCPLALIAGPCVLESRETNLRIATTMRDLCADLQIPYVFKASFDKANRSSIRTARGPGLQAGLEQLRDIADAAGVAVCTDVHEASQAVAAAEAVDLLQVPAFLCRQTDLLVACAETGRPVNVKKSQLMSPGEMSRVVEKLKTAGCTDFMLTERGTFFGYHRLVNDFVGLGDLLDLNAPVCFDVTHSTQLPGGGPDATDGRPDRAALLARAATAAGVHALFVECHPNPTDSSSDATTIQPLDSMPAMLQQVMAIRQATSRQRV
jgi:2-dehydro-3-deoxyphosphooctonate aldolase (KDO 8-P synthase)